MFETSNNGDPVSEKKKILAEHGGVHHNSNKYLGSLGKRIKVILSYVANVDWQLAFGYFRS